MNVIIEFGLCSKQLSTQLAEYNLPKQQIDAWQAIADFIITAHINKSINDNSFYKCNKLLGKIIATAIKEGVKGEKQ